MYIVQIGIKKKEGLPSFGPGRVAAASPKNERERERLHPFQRNTSTTACQTIEVWFPQMARGKAVGPPTPGRNSQHPACRGQYRACTTGPPPPRQPRRARWRPRARKNNRLPPPTTPPPPPRPPTCRDRPPGPLPTRPPARPRPVGAGDGGGRPAAGLAGAGPEVMARAGRG